MWNRLFDLLEENLILIAVFILTITILLMIRDEPTLTGNEGFMYLATGIIITGLVNGIIQKTNAAQQRSNEAVTQTLATAAATSTNLPQAVEKLEVKSEQTTVIPDVKPDSNQPTAPSARPAWLEANTSV